MILQYMLGRTVPFKQHIDSLAGSTVMRSQKGILMSLAQTKQP